MNFIEKPNLPQGRVTHAAINVRAGEAIRKLNALGISTIKIDADLRLPGPVDSHPDMQMIHLGKNDIFCQNEHLCIGEFNKKFNIKLIHSVPSKYYPNDVKLNCSIIGNKLICNKKTVACEILEYAEINELTVIDVNQGYSKCSICIIDENTIITDDKSIYTAAGNFLNDVEFISKGSIRLEGYNYGFIGGCCGKIDKDKIAFNGSIESHKDYKVIIDCLSRHSVECVELHNETLDDIGGILPLFEE